MNISVYFDFPSENPHKLAEFYCNVFGWAAQSRGENSDYHLMTTGTENEAGIDGAITKKGDLLYPVNTIGVENIDEYLQKVINFGGSIHTPKENIPTIGLFAYCLDPDGNQFGLIQPDMTNM